MAHFTCVGATREELRETLGEIEAAGVENVLALRGDPPAGETEWKPTPGGLLYSTELIELLARALRLRRRRGGFPEVHPEAQSREADIALPARRSRTPGASFLITQLFFDNELYFDFVDARARGRASPCRSSPASCPSPTSATSSGSPSCASRRSPSASSASSRRARTTTAAVQDLGVAYATLQCVDLLARGAPGIHFYTLNRSPATRAILAALRAAQPWTRVKEAV